MRLTSTLLATAALFASTAAYATDYLNLNVGGFNALRNDQNAAQFGAEYRFDELKYNFRPVVGVFGTGDGAVYGYGGVNWDVALLPNQLYLVPNFAVGAFGNGDGKDLGGTLEFRSGIELDYQFPNQHQVGVVLNHISNAGIYDHNPGEESVLVNYSIPVSALMGR